MCSNKELAKQMDRLWGQLEDTRKEMTSCRVEIARVETSLKNWKESEVSIDQEIHELREHSEETRLIAKTAGIRAALLASLLFLIIASAIGWAFTKTSQRERSDGRHNKESVTVGIQMPMRLRTVGSTPGSSLRNSICCELLRS